MSDYDYPPDEFDQPPAPGQSVGIHRAPQSSWSKVWPYLVVIVVFAALAMGLVAWFASQNSSNDNPTTPPATTSQAPETETEPEETSSEPPAESEEPSDDETQESPETTPTDDETTSAEVDQSVAIRVLNATNRAGLAASGVNQLGAAGWTAATAANYTGGQISTSAVWFKSEDERAEAEQIASDLGISEVSLQPTLVGPVSVILAGDFTG